MAEATYVNPQPFPVVISDETGSPRSIIPGGEVTGIESHYNKFIHAKGLQRKVGTMQVIPNALPKHPLLAGQEDNKLMSTGLENNGPKYMGKGKGDWVDELSQEGVHARYSKGQMIGLAKFLGADAGSGNTENVVMQIKAYLQNNRD